MSRALDFLVASRPATDETTAAIEIIEVGTLASLPEGRAVKRGKPGRAVLLYREGETVRAFKAYCTHHGMELMENGIDGCRVTCLQHGWRFELPDGRSAQGDRWGLRELTVRIEDGRFEVLWEE